MKEYGMPCAAAVAAALFLVCTGASAVEFEETFEGPCSPDPCGCSGGCGRTGETTYGFDGCYFRTHDGAEPYWSSSVHEEGTGVNGSSCFRAVSESVADMSQSSCFFEYNFAADGDLFVRGCWRFDDAWDDYSLVDQKLYYLYFAVEEIGYGPNVTLFWHAGSSESGWGGDGMELALYSIPGDWCHANSDSNEVQHTNRLKLAEHIDEWICLEVHEDLDEATWVRTLWVTTETGAASLPAGTAEPVSGTMQFHDYEYARQTIAGVPQTLVNLKFGSFINESVGTGSVMWLDELVLSDSRIGHPFGPGPVCGNGACESGETCSSCEPDCGPCTADEDVEPAPDAADGVVENDAVADIPGEAAADSAPDTSGDAEEETPSPSEGCGCTLTY